MRTIVRQTWLCWPTKVTSRCLACPTCGDNLRPTLSVGTMSSKYSTVLMRLSERGRPGPSFTLSPFGVFSCLAPPFRPSRPRYWLVSWTRPAEASCPLDGNFYLRLSKVSANERRRYIYNRDFTQLERKWWPMNSKSILCSISSYYFALCNYLLYETMQ